MMDSCSSGGSQYKVLGEETQCQKAGEWWFGREGSLFYRLTDESQEPANEKKSYLEGGNDTSL